MTKSLIDLAKMLRGIKDDKPDVSLLPRVRYGSQFRDSELGPLRTREWKVEFQREITPRFIGDEALVVAVRARRANLDSDDK